MRRSIPILISVAIAAVGLVGLVVVGLETSAGAAPGNGQQAFDAPGCQPRRYDGPGSTGHYRLGRSCPTPTPVIVHSVSRQGGGWRVRWDGSRSFDPVGGRLTDFSWDVDSGPPRSGEAISIYYPQPGVYGVVLYLTDENGITGTAEQLLRLP